MRTTAVRAAVWQLLRDSIREHPGELRGLVGWSAVQALPALLSGRLVAEAIDHGFLARRTGQGVAWLAAVALALLVGAWGSRQAYQRLAAVVEPFRDSLVEKAVRGALRDATQPGARPDAGTVARLTRHVEIAREAYASVFMVVQGFVVSAVSALIGLVSLMPAVLVLVVPPLLCGLTLFVAVLRRTAARQRVSLLADERIAEATFEFVSGIRDVVASGAEAAVSSTVGEEIEAQARATAEVARFTAVQTCSIALGGWLPVVLILATGSWLRGNGATAGVILGALTYVLQGVEPALQNLIRGIGSNGLWLMVTLDRIVDAIGSGDSEVTTRRVARETAYRSRRRRRMDLEVRDVVFGYGPEPVVDHLDLCIPSGDHISVVGPSGVGKSTLAGLISGLLVPQSGEVVLGGTTITDYDPGTLADLRVLIPQEAYVFSGTLWDNLVYLRPDADESEVDAAVARLGIGPLVERVGGYGGDLSRTFLSAGERQLVTLARSYLSPAPLVILDEATCHLDPAAEARAEQAFARRGGTLVVVAHRVSSARRAARILVMDGTRTSLGTHETLMDESPLYGDLAGHWRGIPQSVAGRPRVDGTAPLA